MLTTDIAYVAGLFDGEGCISVATTRCLTIQAEVHMTDKAVIDWLKESFGGTIHVKKRVANCKQVWCWKLADKEGLQTFLTTLKPYLRIKLPQALIALEILPRLPGSGMKWKDGDQILVYALALRIKDLNQGAEDESR